jgi:prevent-host-death family protein
VASSTTGKNDTIVVSALRARANFGKLLSRVEDERRSLIIEKRGTPRAVLLSIRDYVKLAAPEPEVLRIIGEESERNQINIVTSRQIDQVIKASRVKKRNAKRFRCGSSSKTFSRVRSFTFARALGNSCCS